MKFWDWLRGEQVQAQVRTKILNDPYYRLQSAEEVAIAVELGLKIDVNRANIDDWLRLPGLSIHQARMLTSLAQSGVVFYCVEDLATVLSCPVERLQPWVPLLSFRYYDPETTVLKINPNTATVEALTRIPMINQQLAEAFVENRQLRGNYQNLADLQQRLALSGEVTAQLMYYLQF